ncbi:MAG TPA: hypothetical protein VGM10_00170 [Actinocrinis sp.]
MSTLQAIARLQAYESGYAQPITTVRHAHIADRPMVFIPLQLAGQAAAPLAAMLGENRRRPQMLIVERPRIRRYRFKFAADLAAVLLPYFESFTEQSFGDEPPADAPQIVVPNQGAIAFTAHLGRSTRFRRIGVPNSRSAAADARAAAIAGVAPGVPVVGQWLTWLADRARLPGSSVLLAATDLLRAHWATGQSGYEDGQLAALHAWIDPPRGLTGAEAAHRTADPILFPPAGPGTDPGFDERELAPALEACEAAHGDPAAEQAARKALEDALRSQLEPVWDQVWGAVALLRGLEPAAHTVKRWEADRRAFAEFDTRVRAGGLPQPRRDSAVSSGRRLGQYERELDRFEAQRAYDDPLVMAEYRLAGEAFAGVVEEAEPDRLIGEGRSRKLRPLISVRTSDELWAEPGDRFHNAANPRQSATVVRIESVPGAAVLVTVELTGGMGRGRKAAKGTVPQPGDAVCFTSLALEGVPGAAFPEPHETPWTHGGPPAGHAPTEADAEEDWD